MFIAPAPALRQRDGARATTSVVLEGNAMTAEFIVGEHEALVRRLVAAGLGEAKRG